MTPPNTTTSRSLIEDARKRGAPLTTALRALNQHFGYIDDKTIPELALAYSRSRAEIVGVVSYYCDFRHSPPGQHVLRICQAEACQAVGARELTRQATNKLGIQLNETTPDGQVSLEPVYCLGLCATGPAVEMDGKPAAMVDAGALDALLEEADK